MPQIRKLMYIPEQDPLSLNFMNAGYETILFLSNASSFIFNYAVHITLIVFFPLSFLIVKC